MIIERPCDRCGRPIYEGAPRPPGRPKRWCSAACRRADYAERQAVQRRLEPTDPIEEHVDAVLESPAACRRVMSQIGDWTGDGALDGAKWSSVVDEITRLARRVATGEGNHRSRPRGSRR